MITSCLGHVPLSFTLVLPVVSEIWDNAGSVWNLYLCNLQAYGATPAAKTLTNIWRNLMVKISSHISSSGSGKTNHATHHKVMTSSVTCSLCSVIFVVSASLLYFPFPGTYASLGWHFPKVLACVWYLPQEKGNLDKGIYLHTILFLSFICFSVFLLKYWKQFYIGFKHTAQWLNSYPYY